MRKNIFGLTRARAHSQAAARNVELLEQGCLLPCPNGGIFLPFPTEREDKQNGEAKVLPLKFVFRDRRMPRLLPFVRGSLEGHQNI